MAYLVGNALVNFFIISNGINDATLQLFFTFIFMTVFDIYCLIASSCHLLKIAKHHELSEENRFQYEKKWFWMIIGLLGVMIVTWPLEVVTWNPKVYISLTSTLIADATKAFTAFNLLVIFVLRESVKRLIWQKYRAFRENDTEFEY